MENAWNEYSRLEGDVDWLRSALQAHMNRVDLTQVGVTATRTHVSKLNVKRALTGVFLLQQEKAQVRKELWRIEDVMAGLSTSKANYKVTISSITNPGGTLKFGGRNRQNMQSNNLVKLYAAPSHTRDLATRARRALAVCARPPLTLCLYATIFPREEICAFSVGIISAFCV